MFGIGEIKINSNGKSKEEVKEEIMNEVKKKVDEMFETHEKISKSKKKKKVEKDPLNKLHIYADESEDREGFYVNTDIEGTGGNLLAMLVASTSKVLDELGGKDIELLMTFTHDLFKEYLGFDGDEEEEEDAEE